MNRSTLYSILYSILAISALHLELHSEPFSEPFMDQIAENQQVMGPKPYQQDQNSQQNVVFIQIDNMTAHEGSSFNERVVLHKIDTKVGQSFSQATFDQDLKTLSDEFDKVEPTISFSPDGVRISILIWEKPLIHAIDWNGNTHIPTKKLRKELHVKPYSVFDRQSFNKAINKVREFYLKKGYFQSEIQYEILRHPENNTVTIEVTVHEGPPSYIDKIEITGVTPKEESQVRDILQTSKYNILFSWYSGSGIMREEVIEQDRLRLVNYFQNEGYADAYVNYTVTPSKNPNRINLKVDIEKGDIYKFRNITFKGNSTIPDAEIEAVFQVHPEENYSPEKIRATANLIKDVYGSKGKIETSVDYDLKLIADTKEYDIDFFINEGEEFYVGMIRVYGNTQTNTNVILRESLLVPGEKFDSTKLKITQQRLENIGYFKNVNVYAVRAPDDDSLGANYRDVHIEVEEKPTGNVNLFFGFSTADSVYGGLELVETNFNHHGFSRLFREGPTSLRGGGEYFHAKATIGERQQSYQLSWMDPYFRDTLWRLGLDGNYTTGNMQSKDYRIHTTTGSIYTSYPINFLWSYGFKYRIRYTTTEVNHSLDKQDREEVDAGGLISAVSASLNYDSTDNLVKPRRGLRSNLDGEVAGVGGDFNFGKLTYINTYYASLWRHGIMKYRYDLKYILPFGKSPQPDDIPMSERFFLGGENSVRGYKAFTLGPKFNSRDPKGGITSALISAEYLQEIISMVDAFVFADAGSISLNKLGIAELRMSVGGGLRLELINRVPVTLGYGVPLNVRRADKGDIQNFYISMGGQF